MQNINDVYTAHVILVFVSVILYKDTLIRFGGFNFDSGKVMI